MSIETALLSEVARDIIGYYNKRNVMTKETTPQSSLHHGDNLLKAAVQRANTIAPNSSPLLVQTVPTDPDVHDRQLMAAQVRTRDGKGREASKIYINPAADSSLYAHELGHAVAQKTDAGLAVNRAKHAIRKNPALANAIAFGLASTGAALQEGDDDLIESLAISAALHSPTLIDEALATKNGLAIMQDAGIRANLGQRARLAGGYLSYMAPMMIFGSLGNFAGNLVDDRTAIYDL